MFHLWTLMPALYVGCRFIFLLPRTLLQRRVVFVAVVLVAEFHLISRWVWGNMFSPELPNAVLILLGWGFGAIVIFALLLLIRDIIALIAFMLLRQRRSLLSAGHLLLACALGLSTLGMWQAIKVPEVKNVEVHLPGLPAAFDGYRITQLTDLHISRLLTAQWLEKVVEKTNGLQSDLIVVTGDMIDGYVADRQADVQSLALLRARDGVYAITGNHEYYFDGEAWIAALRKTGLTFLNNEHVTLRRGDDALVLAGITDEIGGDYGGEAPDLSRALAGVNKNEKVILLSHRPDNAHQSAAAGVALQLSGHTHGGMIYGLADVVARANGGYVSGLYAVEGLSLYVSNGTGLWNGFPMRLGKPAEITVITLRP